MRMLAEPAVLDTNVLVYAHLNDSEHNAVSRQLIDQAQRGKLALAVTPQIFIEFYAVITDSRRVTMPYQSTEALAAIDRLLSIPGMTLLPTPPDVVSRWTALARQHSVRGAGVFDYQTVATMLGNNVKTIYTFDREHFDRFTQLQVLTPL